MEFIRHFLCGESLVGAAAAAALLDPGRVAGGSIEIAGDELTMPEVAAVLSTVRGKGVHFVSPPIEQVRAMSEDYALMLEWFDEVGYDVDIAANAARFGVEPTRFVDWARRADWSVAA